MPQDRSSCPLFLLVPGVRAAVGAQLCANLSSRVKLPGSGMQVWGWLLLSGQSVLMSLRVTKHWHRMPRESGTGVRCWSLLLGDGPKTPGDGLGHPVLGGPMEQITQTQRLLLTSAILSITVTINGAGLGACSACGVKAVPKATPRLTGSSSMLCFTHLPMWRCLSQPHGHAAPSQKHMGNGALVPLMGTAFGLSPPGCYFKQSTVSTVAG